MSLLCCCSVERVLWFTGKGSGGFLVLNIGSIPLGVRDFSGSYPFFLLLQETCVHLLLVLVFGGFRDVGGVKNNNNNNNKTKTKKKYSTPKKEKKMSTQGPQNERNTGKKKKSTPKKRKKCGTRRAGKRKKKCRQKAPRTKETTETKKLNSTNKPQNEKEKMFVTRPRTK